MTHVSITLGAAAAQPVWLEQLGRMHVAMVHFPIALLLVAAMVEAWRWIRRQTTPSPTGAVCLVLGGLTAVLAAVMGWFHQSAASGAGAQWHKWLGIATAAGVMIPLLLLPFAGWSKVLRGYRFGVVIVAVLVAVTGHFGGNLTYGEGYLTELVFGNHLEVKPASPAFALAPTTSPAVATVNTVTPASGNIDFAAQVEPILSATCYECHGATKKKGSLRLDSREAILKGGVNGELFVAGKSADSLLIQRVLGEGGEERMPLKHPPLTDAQIDILTKWVDQGARFNASDVVIANAAPQPVTQEPDHWAYRKIKRPDIPKVTDATWVKNPIDAFVLARLEKEGLKPSPEADRITLIRRLSFDLTGLPPTPKEVDAFVNDQSADAYDKLVDRLMASPHYGERMAVYWLDLVRFGDTLGIHNDTQKPITPYRDWVIDAINNNEHFDQFTIEQLAGDLVPGSTLKQKVASAYNRLLVTSEEGGAQPKEYTVKYAADRVRNVSTVWLGATMGCAECHNHKFDPYSQKDFYRMAAFFADVQDNAVGAHRPVAIIPIPTDEQQKQVAAINAKIARLKAVLDTTTPELEASQAKWEKIAKRDIVWTPTVPDKVESTAKETAFVTLPDKSVIAGGNRADKENYSVVIPLTSGKRVTGVRIEVLPDVSFAAQGPGRADNGNFALTALRITAGDKPVAVRNITTDHAQEQWPAAELTDGKQHIPGGWAILPETGKTHALVAELTEDVVGADSITVTLEQQHGAGHSIGRFRVSVTDMARPVGVARFSPQIARFIDIPEKKRNNKQRETVLAYYRTIAPELDGTRAELAKQEKARAGILASARQCEVAMAGEPRVTRILARGNWQDESGEIVTPAIPRFLGELKLPDGQQRATRLDLAKWIVAKDNPLTARVWVNRAWKMFYGIGLSKSLEDMGTQGERPVNPELLDWLASEFMDSGWDCKHVVRLIVSSSAYRQSSAGSKLLHEKDPFNRLVARQSPVRLEGEFIRDNALAMAGILNLQVGGESHKPYQPAGYWVFLNFPKRTYENDHGPAKNRRALYSWWQRTFLHPSLINFDVPSREECTANRTISNTPLQALDLLNDPIFVEAARCFAQRIVKDGGSNDSDRLTWAYHQALSRPPTEKERAVLETLLQKQLKEYDADRKAAGQLVATGEEPVVKDLDVVQVAAWTNVARAIINLHESVTRF